MSRSRLAAVIMIILCTAGPRHVTAEDTSCCAIVQGALAAAAKIKTGVTRSVVEGDFVRDGGLTFPLDATYVFRKCPAIKIKIVFSKGKDQLPSGKAAGDSQDIVVHVSTLFINYENKD